MTWNTIENVRRAETPKAGKSELQFLCFANFIMVIYICIKFQENISNNFQIYYRNHYFPSSKGHNSKNRFTRITVPFLYSAPSLMMLFICVKFHQNIRNGFQLTEGTRVHSRKMFKGPKEVNQSYGFYVLHVVLWCFTLWEISSKYLEQFSTYRVDMSTW